MNGESDRLKALERALEVFQEDYEEAVGNPCPPTDFLGPLGRERSVVVVVGAFKAGKSSLVNALLGEAVAPVDVLRCTSLLTRYRHGATPRFSERRDGRSLLKTQADFRACVAGKVESDPSSVWEVELPDANLPAMTDLFDTPGLNEDSARAALALRAANEADLVLVVVRASQAGSSEELELVESARRRGSSVLVVANRIDTVPVAEREEVSEHLHRVFGPLLAQPEDLVMLSAGKALQGDEDAQGEVTRLRALLEHQLSSERRAEHAAQVLETWRAAVAQGIEEVRPGVKLALRAAREADEKIRRARVPAVDVLIDDLVRVQLPKAASVFAGQCVQALMNHWSTLVSSVVETADDWKSDKFSLWDPSGFCQDIGHDAKRVFKDRFRSQTAHLCSRRAKTVLDGVHDEVAKSLSGPARHLGVALRPPLRTGVETGMHQVANEVFFQVVEPRLRPIVRTTRRVSPRAGMSEAIRTEFTSWEFLPVLEDHLTRALQQWMDGRLSSLGDSLGDLHEAAAQVIEQVQDQLKEAEERGERLALLEMHHELVMHDLKAAYQPSSPMSATP